ncbi:MAG TPA: aminotransferase class I/II-fold pyridoxal phosphate-dependent enzyme [Stellaceae bacterium]|nr:aminotransferase class I/II-fold pyridoxal phosphate-dependent enzyme [Stellaceae bacterium]
MAMKIARRGQIPAFLVMDVMRAANRLAATGADVIHLEVGEPSTGAPAGVRQAARQALETGRLGYTEALGLPELRARIAGHYRDVHRLDLDPARIIVTVGASGAFLLAFLAAFEPGDRVAMAAPGYPAYRHILRALDVEVVTLRTGPEERFQPSLAAIDQAIAQHGPLDGLIVASPSNPAGTMLAPADFAVLAAGCEARGMRLVSDEIYHGIEYGIRPMTAAACSPSALTINSFSKYFSMTGWRLGWMVVPPELLRSVECLAQNMVISAPTLSQLAALAAFDCHDELRGNLRRYAANREVLLNELPAAGFARLAPADGAFYIYADISELTDDSAAFCQRMLADTAIAATPGSDFDAEQGHRFVRFSFAGSTADMVEATRRLKQWRR